VQGIWDLIEEVPIGGNLEIAEDLKMFNVQLERELGGDHCHNIDRIMRVPGTINVPDERKRKKGRRAALAFLVKHRDTRYSLADFTKAAPLQDAGHPVPGRASGNREMKINLPTNIDRVINLDDHDNLRKLKDWVKRAIAFGKDPEGLKVWASRSEMVFAVVCEMVREKIPDETIAAILTDHDWQISESILEKKNVDREVKRILSRAHERAIDPDLAKMNEDHCVVQVGSKTRVMSWEEDEINPGEMIPFYWGFDDFRKFFMKWRKQEVVRGENGEPKVKDYPLGEWWLRHAHRRQFSGVKYMPYSDEEVVNDCLNLWTGFTVPAIKGDKHLSFLEHICENLCNANQEYYEYLIRWMAHRVQRREGPAGVAIVLKSESEGTGKSFFAKHLGALFGKHYKHITNADHLVGKFNAHLQDCQVLFADEAFYAGDKRHAGLLKTIISEDTLMVEKKGIDATASRNYIGMIMASNQKFVVPAGQNARRFFVLDVGAKRMQDSAYFAGIANDLGSGGSSNLMYFLQHMDLGDFNIRNVPKTAALLEQKSLARGGVDALIEGLAQDGQLPCCHNKYPNVAITTGEKSNEGFWAWVRLNHRDLAAWHSAGLLTVLRKDWGCERFMRNGLLGIKFPLLTELRATFDKKHGPQEWDDKTSAWVGKAGSGENGIDEIPF
jgi:hypothetical protein